MAGHSKWKNIQHRKSRQDAAKGQVFTKLIREITVASRQGGQDCSSNSRLRLAVDKALSYNMSKDTIDRAINRALSSESSNLEEVRYEGYGPHGVAIILDCLTDNRNRTAGEIRYVFNKYGGNLASSGSVLYLFKLYGILIFSSSANIDDIIELALELDAIDVKAMHDGSIEVLTAPEDLSKIQNELRDKNHISEFANICLIPLETCKVAIEAAGVISDLIKALDSLDDVQNVYTNADF